MQLLLEKVESVPEICKKMCLFFSYRSEASGRRLCLAIYPKCNLRLGISATTEIVENSRFIFSMALKFVENNYAWLYIQNAVIMVKESVPKSWKIVNFFNRSAVCGRRLWLAIC